MIGVELIYISISYEIQMDNHDGNSTWCIHYVEKIMETCQSQQMEYAFSRVLRNIYLFPKDEYRFTRTWKLLEKMSNFVVKAPSDLVGLSLDGINTVGDGLNCTLCKLSSNGVDIVLCVLIFDLCSL